MIIPSNPTWPSDQRFKYIMEQYIALYKDPVYQAQLWRKRCAMVRRAVTLCIWQVDNET